jgi:hypothetical protein
MDATLHAEPAGRRRGARLFSPAVLAFLAILACAPPPPPGRVYIVRRPPPVRHEVIAVAPGRAYIWIGGFWAWDRSDFVWVPGRWAVPERGFRTWVPARWAHDRHGWYFIEGHWR